MASREEDVVRGIFGKQYVMATEEHGSPRNQ